MADSWPHLARSHVGGCRLGLGFSKGLGGTSRGAAAFIVLRIVEQAVVHATRHGRATSIDVILDVGPADDAVVVVLDDGTGIDDASSGFGVLGMQERAAILGGTFSATPRATGGTRVEVRVPVERLA